MAKNCFVFVCVVGFLFFLVMPSWAGVAGNHQIDLAIEQHRLGFIVHFDYFRRRQQLPCHGAHTT